MARKNDRIIQFLNKLIALCKDGENGYRMAAGAVKNRAIKKLFTSSSAQRARFAAELQTEVDSLGGRPAHSGSVTATLHRGWMNLKSLLTGGRACAVIGECAYGEEQAVRAYVECLERRLPVETKALLLRHFNHIQEAHSCLLALQEVCGKRGRLTSVKAGA